MKDINVWITYHKDEQIEQYSLREDDTFRLFKGNRQDVPGNSINHLNAFYSEAVTLYWVWKNRVASRLVGFCHYRRRFPRVMEVAPGECQVLGYNPRCSVLQQYKTAHNYKDLYAVIDILNDAYGVGNKYSRYFLESTVFVPYCSFVMHWNDFVRLGDFLFGVLMELDRRNHLDLTPSRYREKAETDFHYDDVDYQQRMMGFIAERIISCYLVTEMNILCINELRQSS